MTDSVFWPDYFAFYSEKMSNQFMNRKAIKIKEYFCNGSLSYLADRWYKIFYGKYFTTYSVVGASRESLH